jgi:histidinol-phosphate phosphatase family protein
MRPLTDDRPKPMIEFGGRPFLAYMVERLASQGFDRILMLLGYLPDVIRDYFGDGSAFGAQIEYSVSGVDDLTSRRLQLVEDRLDPLFLLLYCDNYWPIDRQRHWERYLEIGREAMVTVYANTDGYSRDNVQVLPGGRLAAFDRSRTSPGLSGVEISYAILPRTVVGRLPAGGEELVEQALYPTMAAEGTLGALVSEHRYYSVGSMHRLPLTEAFLTGPPAVVLDRDGVLNERPPRAEYVRRPAEFRWLDGAREAIALFTNRGYRVVVVTNQAGIARGAMTAADLEAVHRRMIGEAADGGGVISAIYHCPHDWDEGCACRKPRPGMLYQAQHELQLDLSRTAFIGDDERDAEAAHAANMPYLSVDAGHSLLDRANELLNTPIAATA